MMILDLIYCSFGFVLLYYGAEWLVKGSSSLAKSLGITPILIGLTIVAFGTSAPELVVSVASSLQGKSMIAIGNVVGSNICNIALVLGMAALFNPIRCNHSVIRRDIPIMLGVSSLLLFFSLNSQVERIEGEILFFGVIVYTVFNYYIVSYESKRAGIEGFEESTDEIEELIAVTGRGRQIFLIIVGIAGVVAGAQLVVNSAVNIMTVLGVGEKFIGLTIVAFGTSLPELATSIVAAIRKEMDISIGNLVGSNVFNILSVIGATAIIRPVNIPGGFFESGLIVDYFVMMFVSVLAWFLMRKTFTLTRKGGGLLISCYIAYVAYLIVRA